MGRVGLVAFVAAALLPQAWSAGTYAHEGACVGQGAMHLSTGFGTFFSGPPRAGLFAIHLLVGVCPSSGPALDDFGAAGWISGWCDLAYGYGTTTKGHDFSFTILPNRIVLTGEVSGEMNFVEDPVNVGACVAGSETSFLVTGAVALAHDVPSTTPPLETLCRETLLC